MEPNDEWLRKCEQERNEAFSSISKNQEEYDRQLLTLSSAFIAATVTFVKDVLPAGPPNASWLLALSLIAFVSTVLSVLVSYQISNVALFRVMDFWDRMMEQGGKVTYPTKFAKIVKWLNRLSGLLFGVGIATAVLFTLLNLEGRRLTMSDGKRIKALDAALVKPLSKADEQRGAYLKGLTQADVNATKSQTANAQNGKNDAAPTKEPAKTSK